MVVITKKLTFVLASSTVENSLATQSRLILLDSPLIFFTAFTALAWTNFHNQRKYPFSDEWFIWLFLTGVGLGLAGSVKWVGLFIIATIGTSTINQLWLLWGDLRVTARIWLDHFIARAVCLILIPMVIYMFMFEIHFLLLPASGDGDGFMSAPFQMTLGHSLKDSPTGMGS
jgi:dolichyl-phosphate-mannose-protein mannosyltransferase